MNAQELIRRGVPAGEATRQGLGFITRYIQAGHDPHALAGVVDRVVAAPETHVNDAEAGSFARALLQYRNTLRETPVPWQSWGSGFEDEALRQMDRACQLPVSVAAALMPDAHVGYGLPIGGVLATDNAVIPYAVGVDIACRMKLTVLDLPVEDLDLRRDALTAAIEAETRFGIGAKFQRRREHPVMDADWSVSPVTRQQKERAAAQLGTSGSGNHFVEFGVFTNDQPIGDLAAGRHVALLSHSGSRGTGAAVCNHYSKLAMRLNPDLPREHRYLAWLGLDRPEGQEYWAAMELMGAYAAANHALIHRHIAAHLGVQVRLDVENHHNFAWKETHMIDGVEREVVVHRKGATPAGKGVLGIIPGSMAAPGFLVRGKGDPAALKSASHGAGRAMSRTRAVATFAWDKVLPVLRDQGVNLISAGLDEVPGAYKDIHQVMAAQTDLVEVLARFDPKLVKMAPAGEQPED
ncbi:MAG: RtcB family protein [Verrucomicrobiales bacterium]|nr:RtcB family protein [Verrucomicrobiales bacterium]